MVFLVVLESPVKLCFLFFEELVDVPVVIFLLKLFCSEDGQVGLVLLLWISILERPLKFFIAVKKDLVLEFGNGALEFFVFEF